MLPRDRLFVSTVCLSHLLSYHEVIDTYRQLALPGVELGYCDEIPQLPEDSTEMGCPIICHNYFLPADPPFILNLASQNPTIRERSREYTRRAIEFCTIHDIDCYSFHGGFRTDPTLALEFQESPIPYEDAIATFKESISRLAPFADERDVSLAIENNVLESKNLVDGENEHLLMCEAWEFRELFDDLNFENVGILLDTGHLRVSAETLSFDPYNFVKSLREQIAVVHAHDNDGNSDQHRPLAQNGWAMGLVEELAEDPSIPIVLEGHYTSPGDLVDAVTTLSG